MLSPEPWQSKLSPAVGAVVTPDLKDEGRRGIFGLVLADSNYHWLSSPSDTRDLNFYFVLFTARPWLLTISDIRKPSLVSLMHAPSFCSVSEMDSFITGMLLNEVVVGFEFAGLTKTRLIVFLGFFTKQNKYVNITKLQCYRNVTFSSERRKHFTFLNSAVKYFCYICMISGNDGISSGLLPTLIQMTLTPSAFTHQLNPDLKQLTHTWWVFGKY